MGRPLKIQKYSLGSGDTSSHGVAVLLDTGYPSFASLQANVVKPAGMSDAEYLGVVGGSGDIANAAHPVIEINAMINGVAASAYIIRQKGQTKYLVASTDTVVDGSFTPGYSYIIKSLGTTNWSAIGAGVNARTGDVFTAINAGGAGTGTASDVKQAILTAAATEDLTEGQMNMGFTVDGTNTIYATRLTNKYIWDGATKYAVNFFASGVSTAGSGAEKVTWTDHNGLYELAQVDSYT